MGDTAVTDPRTIGARADFTIDQDWAAYTPEEHRVWDVLYERQVDMLPGLVEPTFLDGLKRLDLGRGGIPNFEEMSEELRALTGWTVVAVPCLVPDEIFFEHLANKRFPAGNFIRKANSLDYIQEPDVFHDVFGHVPLLCNPVFGDYMQAYGEGGLRSLSYDRLKALAALYWYTVEFGLIQTDEGMRIYGAGIVSSASESRFSLYDEAPNRIGFDLERVMKTSYRIDDFQQSYFVINSYQQLFDATVETDFGPLYERLSRDFVYTAEDVMETDHIYHRGTQAYARAGGRFATHEGAG